MGVKGILAPGGKLQGLAEHVSKLNYDIRQRKIVTRSGLIKAGLLIKRDSQKEVPVDKGDLKGSAYVTPEDAPRGFRVEIGYSKVYAVPQHEELGYSHKVGKAKYLEDPFKRDAPEVLRILEEEHKRVRP